jgi:hypothetical protein
LGRKETYAVDVRKDKMAVRVMEVFMLKNSLQMIYEGWDCRRAVVT